MTDKEGASFLQTKPVNIYALSERATVIIRHDPMDHLQMSEGGGLTLQYLILFTLSAEAEIIDFTKDSSDTIFHSTITSSTISFY